jgi:diguanylate cyclase (GGDEF)-like protein
VLRAGDTLALGGDEFVLCCPTWPTTRNACPFWIAFWRRWPGSAAGQAIISTSASVGVTLFPQDDADADTLLRHADQAMYQAKEAGKNRYQLFDPESDRKAQLHRRMLEAWARLCSNSNSCFTTSPRWI